MTPPRKKKSEKKEEGVIKLGEAINIISGAPFKSELFNDVGNGLPLIRVRDVNTGPAGVFYSGEFSKEHLVKTGDLLVSMDGDFKAVRWIYGNGLLNQRVCKVVPNEELLDRRYLEQFLPKALSGIHRETTFTTVKHLSTNTIREIEIPLPPLNDQIRIAYLLSKVEGLIAQRKQHLQQLDDLLKSVFLEMFGDPVRNEKGWERKTIGDLVDDVKYGTSASAKGGQYKYLRMNNITRDGYWDFSSLKFIDVSDADFEKYSLKKGDLVFNRTNSKELVGKTAVYDLDEQVVIAGYLIRVRVNSENNPWFIWGHLNSKFGKTRLFNLCRNIVGMANINAKELQAIPILQPPDELQNQYAVVVEKVARIKSHYQQSLTELENLYGALSQKAFKGELDLSRVVVLTTEDTESTEDLNHETHEKHETEKAFELPAPADLNVLKSREGRKALLGQWLDTYFAQVAGAAFSAERFIDAAAQKLSELMEDEPPVLGTTEYDQLNGWVFQALASGRLAQVYDDAGNRVQIISAKG